ncbi:uncharacterized protein LOC134529867 isoform X2 [Bacillus rossius redtenbacheri]|uniref:uncharacterized protein LOC134529867 isoform X2 n=1 Tax=Bacillus rossius redtenbacheri TaxID=93214 RepID=UPI002FDE1F16
MGTSQSKDVTPKSISRTSSGTNIQDKSQFIYIEKLAKFLGQKSAEETCNGRSISKEVFTVYSSNDELTHDQFKSLLQQVYRLSMDFYPDGPTRTCVHLLKILKAVVDSAFHRKETVSVSFLAHWVQANCSRLLLGLHRYVVHTLTTAYHLIGKAEQENSSSGLELTTPVLDRELKFEHDENVMLPLSEVWLLSTSLPEVFTRPSEHHTPTTSAISMSASYFISKLIGSVCPSHWTMLYNSNDQGLAANRFLFHVLSYRGPTLTLIRGQDGVQFCIGSATEWRESHLYWGDENCIIIQILPLYHIIDRGPKLLYFNSSIRGYPKGIHAGSDKKAPCLQVDEGFSRLTFCGIPYIVGSIEVWGCGSVKDRNNQHDVKKWQVEQAEQARQVKLNPRDWVNNPDRYLLELAGRQSYATTST